MAVSRKLIQSLKTALQAKADSDVAPKMQRYMKSVMPYYGVKAPVMKQVTQDALALDPLNSWQQWYDTVLALWRGAKFREERHCAILLCEAKQHSVYQTLETIPLYEEMIVAGAWWDYVDVVATHRIQALLLKYPKEIKALMKQWSKDDNLWKRRTAILCQLNRKQGTDLTLLYACIKPSLNSDEFFLQKAIGWALRSYAWYDVREVLQYVDKNRAQLSNLSYREALKNKHKLIASV